MAGIDTDGVDLMVTNPHRWSSFKQLIPGGWNDIGMLFFFILQFFLFANFQKKKY